MPYKTSTLGLFFSKYTKDSRYNIILDCNTITNKNYSSSKNRQIKSSIKSGLEIEELSNRLDLIQLYMIFRKLYVEKLNRSAPNFLFFRNFYLLLQKQHGVGKNLIAKMNDKVVGGILCLKSPTMLHEWYISGQDREMSRQKIYPSVCLTNAAIELTRTSGLQFFDFMGAGKVGEPYGVRDFKLKFGGKLITVPRYSR